MSYSDDERPGRSNHMFTLKSDKKDRWFKTLENTAKGKGKWYTAIISEHEYCFSKEEPVGAESQAFIGVGFGTNGYINLTKKEKYARDSAWLRGEIDAYLSETDFTLIVHCNSNKECIDKLKSKYYKQGAVSGNQAIRELTHWKMNPSHSIEDAWADIQATRTIAHSYSKETKFSDEILFAFFTQGLPSYYNITIQSLLAQVHQSIQDKVDVLQEQWAMQSQDKKNTKRAMVAMENDHEEAFLAKGRKMQFGQNFKCWVCESPDHGARKCPFKIKAYEYAKKLRIKQDGLLLLTDTPHQSD